MLDHPTVQEAAGVAQAQANKLYSEGKDKLGQTKLGEKLDTANGEHRQQELTAADDAFAGTPATVGRQGRHQHGRHRPPGRRRPRSPGTKPSGSGTNASTL